MAYRYFATPRRTFILADTPGHVQYTRNMVTGASTADLAVVLIDARHGVVEQTRRHAFIASLLRIPHVVVAVNKMDLVDYAEDAFDAVVREFPALDVRDVTFIPLSALRGDNVVDRSAAMPWYAGPSLLAFLEEVDVSHDRDAGPMRFPVQYVIRDGASDYRGYAGRVAGGVVRPGDEVVVLPSGVHTTVASVDTFGGPLEAAEAGLSVTVRLADDVDVSRGDMICAPDGAPQLTRELHADVAWMSDVPLRAGGRYAIKRSTTTARAIVERVEDRLDVATLAREPGTAELALNDIGRVTLRTSSPVAADPYAENRATGSFILIDEATNDTVGAGMITSG